jgi:hypothetical protein
LQREIIDTRIKQIEGGDYTGSRAAAQQQGEPQATPKRPPPKAGEVRDGYRFNGGDPGDEKNYTKVGG